MENFDEVLRLAVDFRDAQAIESLVHKYHPLILKNSYVDGEYDEDCYQYIVVRVLESIRNFRFELK